MGYGLLRSLDDDSCVVVSLFFLISPDFNKTTVWLFLKRQCFVFLTPVLFVPRNLASQTCSPSAACTSVSSKSEKSFERRILRACIGSLRSASSRSPSISAEFAHLPILLPTTRFMNKSCVLSPQLRRIIFPYPLVVVAPRMHICKQPFSLHSGLFNAKTLGPSKILYCVPFSARRSMRIVLKTSSRLAWTHRGVLMTSEEGLVLRWKFWR